MKRILFLLLAILPLLSLAQTPISDGVLKSSVVGTEKIPVSGAGHPVISGNRLHTYHKARFDSIYVNLTAPKFTLGSDATGDLFYRKSNGFIGRVGIGSGNNVLSVSGGLPVWADMTDAKILFSDITTNNASTSNHGFLKKLDNNAAHFMDGTGNWSTASALNPTEVGQFISDDFNRGNSGTLGANWTASGSATFAINSNKARITGSSSSFTMSNYAYYNAWGMSNFSNFTISYNQTVGTITSTSFGVGVTLQSATVSSTGTHIAVLADNAGSDLGKIKFYRNNSTTVVGASDLGMSMTAGDVLNVQIKVMAHRIVVTVINTSVTPNTTNTATLDGSYAVGNNTASLTAIYYGLMATGGTGTQDIDNFIVTSNELTNADYAVGGDSMTKGIYVNSYEEVWPNLLNSQSSKTFVINAGSSNQIQNLNTSEINLLNPKAVILMIGFNNVDGDANATTTATRYATLATALGALTPTNAPTGYSVANGNLFFLSVPPSGAPSHASLIPTINANLASTYTSGYIPTWNALIASGTANCGYCGPDGIHPYPSGHRIIANLVANFLNLRLNAKGFEGQYNIKSGYNGNTLVVSRTGANYQAPGLPYSPLTIYDPQLTSGAQLQVTSSASSANGLYIQSGGVNGNLGTFDYNYTNTTWTAHGTTAAGFFINTNGTTWYANTGTTAGSTFTPTMRMYYDEAMFKVNNPAYIGGNITPTSTLQVGGSFATAYVAKTATYPITSNDYAIECTANTFTTTLPTAVGITGRNIFITNSGAGTITLATTSSQTFVNVVATPTTLTLATLTGVLVMSNGANWIKISGF